MFNLVLSEMVIGAEGRYRIRTCLPWFQPSSDRIKIFTDNFDKTIVGDEHQPMCLDKHPPDGDNHRQVCGDEYSPVGDKNTYCVLRQKKHMCDTNDLT